MNRAFPQPEGARLDAFAAATDPESVGAWIEEALAAPGTKLRALTPDYLRDKGHDGALVGWRVQLALEGAELASYVTLRLAPAKRLAAEARGLEWRRGERWFGLESFAHLERAGVLLLAYPIDRAIPDLRRLQRTSRLRDLVLERAPDFVPAGLRISKRRTRHELVRYKPERRAVLRWDLGLAGGEEERRLPFYLRLYAETSAAPGRALQRACRAAGLAAPRPLFQAGGRIAAETELPGRAPESAAELAAAGAALARLHALPAPAGLPERSAPAELAALAPLAADCARLGRGLGEAAARLLARLEAEPPAEPRAVPAHGDFHRGQVLVREGTAGLLDFDRAARAAPELDLACWAAHDALCGREGFADLLAGYRAAGGQLEEDALRWHRAAQLLRLAQAPYRRLAPDWPEAGRRLLEEAHAILDGDRA